MHTRNVNVRTAAQESSSKMGAEKAPELSAIQMLIDGHSSGLREGVNITVSEVSRYGDVQVEIRTNGFLNWRAWSFEPDFMSDLEKNLRFVQLQSR